MSRIRHELTRIRHKVTRIRLEVARIRCKMTRIRCEVTRTRCFPCGRSHSQDEGIDLGQKDYDFLIKFWT